MKELTLNGRTYLSTKRAADITGYTTDYVGQLARQGKVDAQLVGRNWYIGEDSIKKHKFGEAQVNVREEKDEAPAPQLEVLMSSADEELQKEEDSNIVEEESVPKKENELPEEEEKDVLEEMQNAWQGWHKAQQSIQTEEDEVFLTEDDEEISIPINRTDVRTQEVPVEEEVVEEEEAPAVVVAPAPVSTSAPVPSPLPVERSWTGTGLAVTAILTLIFVGALTATAGYVLTRNDDHSFAGVYQGVQDYFLGVQRIEK